MSSAAPVAPAAAPPAGTPAPVAPATPPSLAGAPGADPAKPADPVIPEPPKPADPAKPAEPPKEPDAPAPFKMEALKLPEGMKTDDPLMTKYAGIMGDDKITPAERGQKLIDLYAEGHKLARDAATEAWNTVQTDWQSKVKADPDIGGLKWDASKATIAKAIDSLGPELAASVREALDLTGAGNNPAIVKAMHTWASKITEGGHIGGNPPTAPKSVKEAFYPNSPDMK